MSVDRAFADHHLGAAGQHRLDEVGDRRALVLVVGVGVDDDGGAGTQTCVDAGHERGSQTTVSAVRHDVVDAEFAGDVDGSVGAAVVDHEPLDHVDTRHLARQVGDGHRQRRLLVEAGDLDDQLDRARRPARGNAVVRHQGAA